MNQIHVKLRAEEGGFWGEVLEMPGCFASGVSLAELEEALNEAISLYLSDEPGDPPVITSGALGLGLTEVVEVPVAV